jgi:hypothetical protein
MHALSGTRTYDPSVREGEDGSCLRPRGQYDRRGRPLFRLYNLPDSRERQSCSYENLRMRMKMRGGFIYFLISLAVHEVRRKSACGMDCR